VNGGQFWVQLPVQLLASFVSFAKAYRVLLALSVKNKPNPWMRATLISAFAGPPGVEVALAPVTGINARVPAALGVGGIVVGGSDAVIGDGGGSGSDVVVGGGGGGIGVAAGAQAASPPSASMTTTPALMKIVRTFIMDPPS